MTDRIVISDEDSQSIHISFLQNDLPSIHGSVVAVPQLFDAINQTKLSSIKNLPDLNPLFNITPHKETTSLEKTPTDTFISSMSAEYGFAATPSQILLKASESPNIPYPQDALEQKITGTVKLLILLSGQGGIQLVHVIQSSGSVILDNNAVSFIQSNWHFEAQSPETQYRNIKLSVNYTFDSQPSVHVIPTEQDIAS
ncbi:MAG: energy transducer TonB [Gammaproteobacteria bacterium]